MGWGLDLEARARGGHRGRGGSSWTEELKKKSGEGASGRGEEGADTSL